MAGLSEACSHIGAILFATETAIKMQKSVTCTQQENKWLMPGHVKNVPYLPISQIDFTSPKRNYSKTCEPSSLCTPTPNKKKITRPSNYEMNAFFNGIASSKIKPAVLSVMPNFNESYIPKEINVPKPHSSLYQEKNIELDYLKLLEECQKVTVSLS